MGLDLIGGGGSGTPADLTAYARKDGAIYTGVHDFTGASVSGVSGGAGVVVGVPGVWRLAFMGDSIFNTDCTAQALPDRNGYGVCTFGSKSVPGWTLLASKGLFSYGGVFATGGFTAAQVRATHLPEVLAAAPDACVVLAGANKGSSLAQDITDLTAIYTALIGAGITPILCTVLDADSAPQNTQRTTWIRRYARLNNLPLVDFYAALVDPTTGGIVSTYTYDGTHPSADGAKVMGRAIADVLHQHLALHGAPDLPLTDTGRTDLLHTHPLMLTASSGVPTDWSLTSGAAGSVTNPAGPAGVVGNVLTATRGASDVTVKSTSTVTLVAGHRYQFAFKFRATVTSGTVSMRLQNATDSTWLWAFTQLPISTGPDLSTVTFELVVPSGLASYGHQIVLIATGAGSVVELAQFGWEDLTANGIA